MITGPIRGFCALQAAILVSALSIFAAVLASFMAVRAPFRRGVGSSATLATWLVSRVSITRTPASGRRALFLVEVLEALPVRERPRDVLPSDPEEVVEVQGPDPSTVA